ncbi:DUF5777 family beta-barrel protein [Mucilaginibacter defluvii]|uniref:DUF5777 family beta-barrel protein n=1 Tax=Mucilaginibacter defluvii TaxID=1196019 RepID=A0ABP9FPF8_9SPHI
MKKVCIALVLLLAGQTLRAQTDTSSADALMSSLTAEDKPEDVIASFKATRLIFSQTTETVKKHNLNFLVTHRFGDIAGSEGGGSTLFGLDNSSDIFIGFEYGLTDNLDLQFGRSKYEQLIEAGFKYAVLHQKADGSMPFSLALAGKMGLKPYSVNTDVFDDYTNRINYMAQAIIARKFSSKLSVLVSPTFVRNNLPFPFIDGNEKDYIAISAAARYKITKRFGLVVDYAHPFSSFRNNSTNPKFYDPLGVGIEVETGGHVFTLNFSNSKAISEMNFLSDTQSSWDKGQYRLGFTISRMFDLGPKHNKNKKQSNY